MQKTRARSRYAVLSGAALFLAACGGGAGGSPTAAPSAAASVAPSGEASTAPTDAQSTLDGLKERLQGASLVVGTSASKNAALTGVRRTLQFLTDDFGVTVDYRELDSDPLVAALISDQIQVGQLSLAGTIAARDAGTPFKAFAGDDKNNIYIVVAKAPITTLEELEGQPFGATQSLSQITGQTARACLETVGLDIENDVQLIRLSNTGDIMTAIQAGQVVGGLTAPHRLWPRIVEEGEGVYNILCRGKDTVNQLNNVWMAREDWIAENGDLALAIAVSALNTGRWSSANEDEWKALAKEIDETLTDEAAELAYTEYVETLDQWPANGALDRDLCQATADSALESETISEPITCDEIATFEFQDQALEILGEE